MHFNIGWIYLDELRTRALDCDDTTVPQRVLDHATDSMEATSVPDARPRSN